MKTKTRARLFAAGRALPHYPWQVALVAVALASIALLCALAGWADPTVVTALLAFAGFAASNTWWFVRHILPPGSAAGWSARRSEWAQRTKGFAGHLDIAEHASPAALQTKAHVLRPGLTHIKPRKIPPTELGVLVVTLAFGWWGEKVWSSIESSTVRVGAPRSGKSVSLIVYGLTAPGALITTSTRLDLAEGVHQARKGKPVWVFNPRNLGDVASNVMWSVVAGCEDYETATRRAYALIPSKGGDPRAESWSEQARNLFAVLLNAAAIDGRDMATVARWARSDDDETRDQIVDILRRDELGGEDRADTVLAHWATNPTTRTSVTFSMKPAYAWLNDPRARELGDTPPGAADLFDIRQLILGGETLHLLGHSEDGSPMAALIACLVGEITYETRKLAGGRRIDPPVTMLLDEVALVCPIPLPDWMADFGGAGITVHVSVQSIDQLEKRWGRNGANTILTTANTLIVFGGSNNDDELAAISTLCGEHMRKVIKADSDGDYKTDLRWTAVHSPAEIRALPAGTALVLRQGLLPVIGTAPAAYERKGWRPLPLDIPVPSRARVRPGSAHAEWNGVTPPRPRIPQFRDRPVDELTDRATHNGHGGRDIRKDI